MTNIKENLRNAVKILRRGGVVIFPTETAYGIGCDATDAAAVGKIYEIKGRGYGKPLPVIAADLAQVKRFFKIKGLALALAKKHWPGPLSIILEARNSRLRRALGRFIAVRVSSHPLPRKLAGKLSRPVVATSANPSGKSNCYSAACARRQLKDRGIGLVIDGGILPRRQPSTVVKIVAGRISVVRPGPVRIPSSTPYTLPPTP